MEHAHLHAAGHAHAEHGFKAGLAGKHMVDIAIQGFSHGSFRVEGRVVEELSAGVLDEGGESGHVGVLRRAEEDIHGHLLLYHKLGDVAVEIGAGLEQLLLGLSAEDVRGLTDLELATAGRGKTGLEEHDLTTAILKKRGGKLEGVGCAGLGVLGLGMRGGEDIEEVLDGLAVINNIDQQGGGDGEEDLFDLRDHHLLGGLVLLG